MTIIELEQRHIKICKEFASFRRTLTEAVRLLDQGNDANPEEAHDCSNELEVIIPTIEALQIAVKGAVI